MALQQSNDVSLNQLLEILNLPAVASDIIVSGLAMDSRQIVNGDLFLACAGLQTHGIEHADQAVANGAVAILAEVTSTLLPAAIQQLSDRLRLPVIAVSGLSESVSELAGLFYGQPSLHLPVIGITGTNGKTSCSHFIANACQGVRKVGIMGTLGNGFVKELKASSHTTMDPVSVQAQLALFLAEQAEMVAMEVSSHALQQNRVAAVQFDTAVLTNFSRDHLDYHGTMADYAKAKSLLFKMPGLKHAIINMDDELGRRLVTSLEGSKLDLIVFGEQFDKHQHARYLKAVNIKTDATGVAFTLESYLGDVDIVLPLLGKFNVYNALVALAIMLNNGVELSIAAQRLQNLQPVNGRMQLMYKEHSPKIVIDFAHTPDALQQVLASVRQHVQGQLICVFGCGGDRDKGKRPIMGAIAEQLADRVILTDDNPRSEAPDTIVNDILSGFNSTANVGVQHDRQAAIIEALSTACHDDMIVIAGKGHETYQIIGDKTLPFSDEQVVADYLREVS